MFFYTYYYTVDERRAARHKEQLLKEQKQSEPSPSPSTPILSKAASSGVLPPVPTSTSSFRGSSELSSSSSSLTSSTYSSNNSADSEGPKRSREIISRQHRNYSDNNRYNRHSGQNPNDRHSNNNYQRRLDSDNNSNRYNNNNQNNSNDRNNYNSKYQRNDSYNNNNRRPHGGSYQNYNDNSNGTRNSRYQQHDQSRSQNYSNGDNNYRRNQNQNQRPYGRDDRKDDKEEDENGEDEVQELSEAERKKINDKALNEFNKGKSLIFGKSSNRKRRQTRDSESSEHIAKKGIQEFVTAETVENDDKISLDSIIPLNELIRNDNVFGDGPDEDADSLWDLAPKGYEAISVLDVKFTGIFHIPGTKTNEFKNDIIKSQENIIIENSKESINKLIKSKLLPDDSKNSKRLILSYPVTAIEENNSVINSDVLKEYYTNLLINSNIPGLSDTDKEITIGTTSSPNHFIIESENSLVITILISTTDVFIDQFNMSFSLERPGEYIPFKLPEYLKPEKDEMQLISNKVNETIYEQNSRLFSISNISIDTKRNDLIMCLLKVEEIKSLLFVTDKLAKDDCKGFALFEFKDFVKINDTILNNLNNLTLKDKKLLVKRPCLSVNNYSQKLILTHNLFKIQAKSSPHTTYHKFSRVIELINCFDVNEILDDSIYNDLKKSVENECSKYGRIEKLEIPKPINNEKLWIDELSNGIGKIFIKYSNETEAKNAIENLAGKRLSNRLVLVRFFDENDFNLGLF